ncbi:MAG: hypothetical protein IT338_14680 [Thermomicrobiales bacterium]|nr:hypothetical protein [Thermomicrobiales bacterium]
MDDSTLDVVTKRIGTARTRREAIVAALAVAAGGIGLPLLGGGDAEAKKHKKKKRCLKTGKPCKSKKQCCSKDKLLCDVPVNGSNSDTFCCGGQGSKCGPPNGDGDDTKPFCCVNFECVNQKCVPVPDEP